MGIVVVPAPGSENEAVATGVAMVIAPGGGHSQLVIDKEGWQIAEWCNDRGIAALVLQCRRARAKDSHYTVEGDALPDAA
ncbi:MAG TPA: hypothetical protein VGS58_00235 [Candidatus Sulfopaludibacter sp.]|nr:hypothetical protein [Candidatus Sulfopaludibacter sp.]